MEIEYIDREKTNKFGNNALRLIDQHSSDIKQCINRPFDLTNFEGQIEEKKGFFTTEKRHLLANEISKLYTRNNLFNEKNKQLIDSLRNSNTFTVTTGHQLSLYAGPLYFIYKILHTIKLSESLNMKYPAYNFVPIYWMASEDHDFEEIKTIQLFNEKYSWNSDQKGAVGSFSLKEFDDFKSSLNERFSNDSEILQIINENYQEDDDLSSGTFKLVHQLFEKYNLLIIDANNKELKSSFSSIIKKDLTEKFSNKAVEKANQRLDEFELKKQIHSREINLFYIDPSNKRSRIIPYSDFYEIDHKKYTKEELLLLLEKHPERFSPNVVLRPLYQEYILPNLAYIGGAGEISYWLQLKNVFEEVNVPYPIIQVRNSIQIIEKSVLKKMEKLQLSTNDIFKSTATLKKEYLLTNSGEDLNFDDLDEMANQLTKNLEDAITKVDGGLKGYAISEVTRFNKQLQGVKQKLIRQKKKLEEDSMQQIENIHDRLFPEGNLQERKLNVLQFFVKHGKEKFMDEVYQAIDPEENRLILLKE
jgi:bacillithiol biosynthesis cysteine-adding enzyme BshC